MKLYYAAIVLGSILVVFLIVKEIQRENKARLFWRILASVMAVCCLVLMLIPITYQVKVKDNLSEITLLTSGTSTDSIYTQKDVKLYTTDPLVKASLSQPVEFIPDLTYFLRSHKEVNSIKLYGSGLQQQHLKDLKGYPIEFHASPLPQGVLSANWNKQVNSTSFLFFQGTYNNIGNKITKLVLRGSGSNLDSVNINIHSKKQFSFKVQPKQLGKVIYQLIALQEKDTLAKDPVPFEVLERNSIKTLILASYPDFEYKFLKNWLFENGYSLAFRSRISKDKYSTEFLNGDKRNINSLSGNLLKDFDVLIIDEDELALLTLSEKKEVVKAVESGMGLLIRKTDMNTKTAIGNRFAFYSSEAEKKKVTIVNLEDQNRRLDALPVQQNIYIRSKFNDQPLVTGSARKIVVNSQLFGAGKILVSVIPSTFQWLLSGKTNDYASYWSLLLTKAARKQNKDLLWTVNPLFPLVNVQTRIFVEQESQIELPRLIINGSKVSPRQNFELPFKWDANFWPEKHGWNSLAVNGQRNSFFVYQKGDWKPLRNYTASLLTKEFIKDQKLSKENFKFTKNINKTVPIWWFYIGFIVFSSYLWYELRILSVKY